MMAKMFALKDGTAELTCTLIEVIRESAKN
jgi:hypothetical protein